MFARTAIGQPWQQQAALPTNSYRIALSADGNTLAASESDRLKIYQRSSGTWSEQTTIASTQAPAECVQPCQLQPDRVALSDNGNLLAVSGRFKVAGSMSAPSAVFTYVRTGSTWAAQSYFAPGGDIVGTTLALSGDGSTLALNSGAITRGTYGPPHVHIYAQDGANGWKEQARLPVGVVFFEDIAASVYSAMALSSDGNTLAVDARNSPNTLPPEYHITVADLTCPSAETGNTPPVSHIAVFARSGAAWQRQAVIARKAAASWALASDGNALFYGSELFNRRNGTWACP